MGEKNSTSFKAMSLRSLSFLGRNQCLSLKCCVAGSLYTWPLGKCWLVGGCPLYKGVSIHLLLPQSCYNQALSVQAGRCPSQVYKGLCSSLASSVWQGQLCLILSIFSSISEQQNVYVNHLNSLRSASWHFYF